MPIGVGVDVSVRRGLDVVVLDAARRLVGPPLAALVAVIVAEDGPWFCLGEPDEGCVVLPGREPAGPYPRG